MTWAIRVAPKVGVVATLAFLVPVLWGVTIWKNPLTYPADAIPTYMAARMWALGHFDAVYHLDPGITGETLHRQWLVEAQRQHIHLANTAFNYHPLYLILTWPVTAWLSFQGFLRAVLLGNILAALVLGFECARLAPRLNSWQRPLVVLAVATCLPAAIGARLGQNVLMAAAMCMVGFRWSSEIGWKRSAGVALLIVACLFKQWCLPLLGAFLLARQWKLFASSVAAAGVVLWGIPSLVVPTQIWTSYGELMARLPKFSLFYYYNVSLRALIQRLLWDFWPQMSQSWDLERSSNTWAQLVEYGILFTVCCLILLPLLRKKLPVRPLGLCLMALCLLPLGVCWVHYLVFAVPVIVLVLVDGTLPTWVRFLGGFTAVWFFQVMDGSTPKAADLQPPEVWAWVLSMPLLLTCGLALLWLFNTKLSDA